MQGKIGKKSTFCLKSLFLFFGGGHLKTFVVSFVLLCWLIKFLPLCSETGKSLDSFFKTGCAFIHHNFHHPLTISTVQTTNGKHPSNPTSFPAWPDFPFITLKIFKEKKVVFFKWSKEQSKDIHYQIITALCAPPTFTTFTQLIPVAEPQLTVQKKPGGLRSR